MGSDSNWVTQGLGRTRVLVMHTLCWVSSCVVVNLLDVSTPSPSTCVPQQQRSMVQVMGATEADGSDDSDTDEDMYMGAMFAE